MTSSGVSTCAGGGAFGLEASSGALRIPERREVGQSDVARVPIMPGAILYDLGIGKTGVRPTREMGEKAVEAAVEEAMPASCPACVRLGKAALAARRSRWDRALWWRRSIPL